MFRSLHIFILLFSLLSPFLLNANNEDSSAIFLPKGMQQLAKASQNYSFFWKGMLLIDASQKEKALSYASRVCEYLKNEKDLVSDYYCGKANFRQNQEHLIDWVKDITLRQSVPSIDNFQKTSLAQLSFASLPGIPREIISSLRFDPFQTSQELWALKEKLFTASSTLNGYFSNTANDMIMIPVAFKHSPQEREYSTQFMEKFQALCSANDCPDHALVGPHAATWINQKRIVDDLTLVSFLGGLFFVLLMLFLGKQRGLALLSLCVPLVPSLALAIGVVYFVFGSVHGLTLAFGPSLVGLALDYGLHTKIHKGSKEAWSSNLFGLLTTLVGFVILLFSEIPLIRQMMVFALVGLLCSFVLYYWLSQSKNFLWKSTHFEVFSFHMGPKSWRGPFIVLMLIASFALLKVVPLNLNLKNFEFRQEHQNELEKKWWTQQKAPEVLFSVSEVANTSLHRDEKKWASQENILLQSWSTYVPPQEIQEKNLNTWKATECQFLFDSSQQKFFEPFRNLNLCPPQIRNYENVPSYAQDFVSRDKSVPEFLSVWFPKSDLEKAKIEARFPSVTSLRKVFESFPKVLLREIVVMFPLGFILCFILIYIHVRKFFYSFLAVVPMLSAIGFVLVAFAMTGKALSFVGCIALLMIFGSSVDYGIFQVDSLMQPPSKKAISETFSSLFMQALPTFLGYLPMVFAKHPVLNDLGVVLCLGTVGAFLGGVWGVPYLIERIRGNTQRIW